MEYGTGAIFGCPAHDQRDLEFARKYRLPVIPVVLPPDEDPATFTIGDTAYADEGVLINSAFLDGLSVSDAKRAAGERLEKLGLGERTTIYRLRDWGVSRQRYWGCPIPVIYCSACGIVPVPEKDLPVTLPQDVSFEVSGNPLDHHPTWKHVLCPRCGGLARRETDTLDTFFEFILVFPEILFGARPGRIRKGRSRLLDAGRSIHRRHRARGSPPALLAFLHPRLEAMRLPRSRGTFCRVVHARHGLPRDLS